MGEWRILPDALKVELSFTGVPNVKIIKPEHTLDVTVRDYIEVYITGEFRHSDIIFIKDNC